MGVKSREASVAAGHREVIDSKNSPTLIIPTLIIIISVATPTIMYFRLVMILPLQASDI